MQIGANPVNEHTKLSSSFRLWGDGVLIAFLRWAVFVLLLQEQTVL